MFSIGHTHSVLTIQESGKFGLIFLHARSELTAQGKHQKIVLHLNDSTVPKLINSGFLRRQLNCIWNMRSLKSSSLGPKHKLTRDAGCRLCKTTYGYAPLQVSGMGLRIHSHLRSNVNWSHQLLPSLPCHLIVQLQFILTVFTEKGRTMIQFVIQKIMY